MKSSPSNTLITVVSALLLSSAPVSGANSIKLTGSIVGIVRDAAGVPQMGASVMLFSQYERIMQRAFTDERGAFGFDALPSELYSVRVNLASFVPAVKQKISVQPGMRSLLYINMASLLSSIELVYAAPGQGALMSDDWKWTLKSALSTRPILRFLPEVSISDPGERPRTAGAIFSDTRGLVRVSGGDGGSAGDLTAQPDLGTAFALATSLFGRNQLQVSGNVGHVARTGLPAASFRTSYSHDSAGPQFAVTVRQMYLPMRAGLGLIGQQDGAPALRSMSFSFADRVEFGPNLRLEYGTSLDSVVFLEHLNYFSPFARLSYELGKAGTLRAAYSSGAPPAELFSRADESEAALHQDLTTLSLVPRVSLRGGRVKVQRTQSFEIGYEKKLGSRTLGLTAYRELVSNGALTLAGGGDNLFLSGDVLPDFSSNSGTFNVGSYERYGYSVGVSQSLGEKFEIGFSSGRGGVFVGNSEQAGSNSGDDIRSRIHTSQRYWASARGTMTLPVTGTRISTNYEWIDYNAIMPTHLYLTQSNSPQVGWNVQVRQPIRGIPGMSGRLEATADLRNLFAQGYIPLAAGDAQRLLLMQAPRAVRGGLSFIF